MPISSSPFPGMDPYLESSRHWDGFHRHLGVEIVRALNPHIIPKYFARLETGGDVLRTVGIYKSTTGEIVTNIKIFSPNEKIGEELNKYRQARNTLLTSKTNLIEIDLLRGGQRPGPEVNTLDVKPDYIMLRNNERDKMYRVSKIWLVDVSDVLPAIPIPLLSTDRDVLLDLGSIVRDIYATNYYGLQVDYKEEVPAPALRPGMAVWWDHRRSRA